MYLYKEIKENFPLRTFLLIIITWIVLALLNYVAMQSGIYTGLGYLFPISVLYPSHFTITGPIYLLIFLCIGYYSFYNASKFNAFSCYIFCTLLILFGNLGQGNIHLAMVESFYIKGYEYYSDAILINDWKYWLDHFNENQPNLLIHTKTHPPFITLFHYFILFLCNNILFLSICFSLLSTLSFIFIRKILLLFLGKEYLYRINILTLLFSIIPSVNIYTIVSVDGIILSFATMSLWGIIKTAIDNKITFKSILFTFVGLAVMSSFTFGSTFLLGTFGLFSFFQLFKNKSTLILKLLIITCILLFVYFVALYFLLNYNHIKTFQIASYLENKNGFRGFYQPKVYINTRIEDISEVLLFLSFGYAAVILNANRKYLNILLSPNSNKINVQLFYSAIFTFLAMLVTGAYATGETARACLFIYPFFLIILTKCNQITLNIIYFLALFQTFGMQLIGNFHW